MGTLTDRRYPYREILQHRSLLCHQLLGQTESRLLPYHASEQAHREGGLRRTWLYESGRRAEAKHLIFVDTTWSNEYIEASQRSHLPP